MQGSLAGNAVVCAAFEFDFMGGSMGAAVGERFVQGVLRAIEEDIPFICISASGGASDARRFVFINANGEDQHRIR